MSNIPDVLTQLSKYPLILPRPDASSAISPKNHGVVSNKMTELIGHTEVGLSRENLYSSLPAEVRIPSQQVPLDSIEQKQTPESQESTESSSLLILIDKFLQKDVCLSESSTNTVDSRKYTRNYRRETAVKEAIKKYNINLNVTKETFESFFDCLGQYDCFGVNEIIAAKRTLYMLQFENGSDEEKYEIWDKPSLISLITQFEKTSLRGKPSVYAPHSTGYRREQAVLDTFKTFDFYCNLSKEMIDKFFCKLTRYSLFKASEIAAVRMHVYSFQHKNLKDSNFHAETMSAKENKNHYSQNSKAKKSKGSVENKTTVELESTLLFCPICVGKIEEEDAWQHIIKQHVEWDRASKYELLSGDKKFCTHCFKNGFNTVNEAMRHETKIHGTNTENSCTFCGCTCHDIFAYYCHIVGQHGYIFQCSICGEEFCLKSDLKFHQKLLCSRKDFRGHIVRQRYMYFCPFCNTRFQSRKETVNHLFNKYNASKPNSDTSKRMCCFSCSQQFVSYEALDLHIHISAKCSCKEPRTFHNFICFACKESFETQEALEFHQSPKADCILLAPYARPKNFRSSVFTVTCDIKRLRRADLAEYPQALESILESFELIHSSEKQSMPGSEIKRTENDDLDETFLGETLQNRHISESRYDFCQQLVEDQNMVKEQKEAKNREYIPHIPHTKYTEMEETSVDALDNLFSSSTPLSLNDGQGNTVIINNQKGGSNTIILGNCCSTHSQSCLTQNLSGVDQPQNSAWVTHPQTTSNLLSDTVLPEIETLEADLHLESNKFLDKEKRSTKDIKAVIRETIQKIDVDKDFETQKIPSNEENQGKIDRDEEIREIVREEFRKYFAAVHCKNIPAAFLDMECFTEKVKKLDTPYQKTSESFMTDRDSMQALYGIKSELDDCNFMTGEQKWDDNLSSFKSDKMTDDAKPERFRPIISSLYNDTPGKLDIDFSEVNEGVEKLITEIKEEPESPESFCKDNLTTDAQNEKLLTLNVLDLPVSTCSKTDTEFPHQGQIKNEHLTELHSTVNPLKNRTNDGEKVTESCLEPQTGICADSYPSNSLHTPSADQTYNSTVTVTPHKDQIHNEHITELQSIVSSIENETNDEDKVIESRLEPQIECLDACLSSCSRQSVNVNLPMISMGDISGSVQSKTVAYLFPAGNACYFAGVVGPSKSATVKNSGSVGLKPEGSCKRKRGQKSHKYTNNESDKTKNIDQTIQTLTAPLSGVQSLSGSVLASGTSLMTQTLIGQVKPQTLSNLTISGQGEEDTLLNKRLLGISKTLASQHLPGLNIAKTTGAQPFLENVMASKSMVQSATDKNQAKHPGNQVLSEQSVGKPSENQTVWKQSKEPLPAPPTLQGPNMSSVSMNALVQGLNIPIVNQNLPRLSIPLMSANQTPPHLCVPVTASTQSFVSLPMGNQTSPRICVPIISGIQSISSLNIPIMSTTKTISVPAVSDQAGPSRGAKTGSLSLAGQCTGIKSESQFLTVQSTPKESENDDIYSEFTAETSSQQGQVSTTEGNNEKDDVSIKKEKVDLPGQDATKSQNLQESQEHGDAATSLTQTLLDSSLPVRSLDQSFQALNKYSTCQTVLDQHQPIFSSQTLPMQAIQMQSASQAPSGQTIPVLSSGQAISGQTIPFFLGRQAITCETIPSLSSQAKCFPTVSIINSGQKTPETITEILPSQTITAATRNVELRSCPLQFVGAAPSGFVFQTTGNATSRFLVPQQTVPKVPISRSNAGIARKNSDLKQIKNFREYKRSLSKILKIYEEKTKVVCSNADNEKTVKSKGENISLQTEKNLETSVPKMHANSAGQSQEPGKLEKPTSADQPQRECISEIKPTHSKGVTCAEKQNSSKESSSASTGIAVEQRSAVSSPIYSTAGSTQQVVKNSHQSKPLTLQLAKPAGIQQKMVPILPSSVQPGNILQQNTLLLNQGISVAPQQNPLFGNQVSVFQPGFHQNITGPVQNVVFHPGQVIQQPLIYQPVHVQSGPFVFQQSPLAVPQYIVAGTGSQSNPVMFVGQSQAMNVTTQNQSQCILPTSSCNPVITMGQEPGTSVAADIETTNQQPIVAKLRDDGTIVSVSDLSEKNDLKEPQKECNDVENLIKDLNLQIGMDEAKDMLNYFKKYIEQGQLPSKDGIDCYLNIWMSKKRPYFRQCAYAEGRHIIQNLLQACINKSVDMTSPVQHKAYGWSEMEDLELQNCFRQHFQENNVPTLAECNMAVGLAKILNWTIKRRSATGIHLRVRTLMRKDTYKRSDLNRKRRRKRKVVADLSCDSELDDPDRRQKLIKPCGSVVRDHLNRKVKEKSWSVLDLESSDTDDYEFEFITDPLEADEDISAVNQYGEYVADQSGKEVNGKNTCREIVNQSSELVLEQLKGELSSDYERQSGDTSDYEINRSVIKIEDTDVSEECCVENI